MQRFMFDPWHACSHHGGVMQAHAACLNNSVAPELVLKMMLDSVGSDTMTMQMMIEPSQDFTNVFEKIVMERVAQYLPKPETQP
jgi:hypothetical protein